MMTGRLTEHSCTMNYPATLRIFGGKSERVDPGQGNRSRAHRAGLQRNPQGAAVEPRPAKPGRGMADRDHFGMGGGIEASAHRIARLGDDFIAQRDDRPNRHLARLGGDGGEIQRSAHR